MRHYVALRRMGLLLAVLLVVMVSPAAAGSTGEDVLYGTGSVFSTLVYAPFKATFCILGGITSVFSLPFGGTQMAGDIASAACGGTWAITPNALKGEEPVRFIGGAHAPAAEPRPAPGK